MAFGNNDFRRGPVNVAVIQLRDLMDNSKAVDIVRGLYQEHSKFRLHHEQQRSTATGLILTLAGVSIGFITFDDQISLADWPLALLVLLLGLLGFVFSRKQYERFKYHDHKCETYITKLEELVPESDIANTNEIALAAHRQAYPANRIPSRLNVFWSLIHLIVALFGTGLLATCLFMQNAG